jgi:hypothetical protein
VDFTSHWLNVASQGLFSLYAAGEVTKLVDNDGDDVADAYSSFYKGHSPGNYHEYSYGPVLLPDGDMVITLNSAGLAAEPAWPVAWLDA